MPRARRTPLASTRIVTFRLNALEKAQLERITAESRRSASDLLRTWIVRAGDELDAGDGLLMALAAAD